MLAVAGSELAGPVNVGTPDEMTVAQIAQEVITAAGSSSSITFIPAVVDDPKVRRPDISLAREILEWEPTIDLREGLRLYEKGTGFGSFDAVLAAAARAAGADALVSADTSFSRIAVIHHVVPDTDCIRHLLGTSER